MDNKNQKWAVVEILVSSPFDSETFTAYNLVKGSEIVAEGVATRERLDEIVRVMNDNIFN